MTTMTNIPEESDNWTVAKAKARFSQLIERAQLKGPQTITKHGRVTAIVVSVEEWKRKTKRKGTLLEFFAPLQGSGAKIERLKGGLREVEL
jgi:prevent-host-death family protein